MFEPPSNLDLGPEKYNLVIGERIGHTFAGRSVRNPSNDPTESSHLDTRNGTDPLEFWDYLKSLRDPNAKVRPTFYFPDHKAGPDLVFALEPIIPKVDKVSERVLCVVQLKTARKGIEVQKAIMTTDLSLAHLSKNPENSEPLQQSSLRRRVLSDPLKTNDTKPIARFKKRK
ncbi:hypothetical protein MMC18_004348 [Xylographa bjoerkii]|nr:hypothetical protein [Xylographa bjoerkii]